ncbi:MAG: Nudix family hydrolase [Pseudomonadota bacterium]
MPNTVPDASATISFPQHVVAAAIFNERAEVLLALRPAHLHQGGLWEFPGGKVEPGEDVCGALARELDEELGIRVTRARPLIRVHHTYPDKAVLLDVWRVEEFSGAPVAREGQRLEWVAPENLAGREYPAANLPIITAVRLPELYVISGEPLDGDAQFLHTLENCLRSGARLVQLRVKTLDEDRYRSLAQQALALCRAYDAQLLLNTAPQLAAQLGAHGVHLTSARLMALRERPLGKDQWVAASCHNAQELAHAQHIGVDFAVVAPVLATPSHPGAAALGWEGLRALTEQAALPVYALGGMHPHHMEEAQRHGAQGIAAISSVWNAT